MAEQGCEECLGGSRREGKVPSSLATRLNLKGLERSGVRDQTTTRIAKKIGGGEVLGNQTVLSDQPCSLLHL